VYSGRLTKKAIPYDFCNPIRSSISSPLSFTSLELLRGGGGGFPLHGTFTPFMSVKKKAPTILEKKKKGKCKSRSHSYVDVPPYITFPNTISNRKGQNRMVIWREKEATVC